VPSRTIESKAFVALAAAMLDRLLKMEADDNALKSFATNIQQTRSQSLADDGRYRQAIALQRQVIAMVDADLRQERLCALLNRMAMVQVTMGQIAERAGDSALSCRSYRSTASYIAELDQRKELLGFVESRQPEVNQHLAKCA
jgi:hypothetical protein